MRFRVRPRRRFEGDISALCGQSLESDFQWYGSLWLRGRQETLAVDLSDSGVDLTTCQIRLSRPMDREPRWRRPKLAYALAVELTASLRDRGRPLTIERALATDASGGSFGVCSA
jgi:hypothetical protein